MYLENYLNENTNSVTEEFNVEATQEGFDFQNAGVQEVIGEALRESNALNMAQLGSEVMCVKLMNENAQEEAETLQESVITSFFAKVKEIIKKMWARMKEVMNTVVIYFTKLANDKAFINRIEDALKSYSDFSGLEIEGYDFTLDALDPQTAYESVVKAVNSSFDKVKVEGAKDSEGTKAKIKVAQEALEKATDDDAKDSYLKAGFKCSKDDFNEEMFKAFRNGKDSKESISFNKSACVKAVNDYKTRKNQAESLRKKVDRVHSDALKAVDALSKALPTEGDKSTVGLATQFMKGKYSKQSIMIKDMLVYANKAVDAKIRAIRDERSQAKSILTKALSKGKKNAKVSESTNPGDILDTFMSKHRML